MLTKLKKNKWPLVFTGTNIVLFVLFFFLPAILGFYYSLTDYKGFASPNFIGFENYTELFQDASFYKALFRTFRYAITLVPLIYVVSLSIALLLNSKYAKGKVLGKIIIFLPWTISGIIAGVIWKWLFGEHFGFINYILTVAGGEPVAWATGANASFAVIIMAALWGGTAFNMLQFTTALKNIPASLYEAADMDGASSTQKFWNITLPAIKPTSFMVILLASIGAMKEFALVQSLTNGGPGTANVFIVQYIYQTGFEKSRVGYASAASMVLFVILLIFGLIQMRIGGRRDA
ncbi:carbohydrate ABC transporter permease [Jeotgalibaca caeni]|uniref:carbohydrate ABC transporter permease n=1 Tax=Jeotgalibaca caeni TaxID=3028623 RepID=UPI00237E4E80|nr:sugar ABC transporter permease [Jeotgalibaca caeni]MDE1549295.1 sugar ABC transporter permease [Jeotgalibaca caeni]